jgi:hypothetical protein
MIVNKLTMDHFRLVIREADGASDKEPDTFYIFLTGPQYENFKKMDIYSTLKDRQTQEMKHPIGRHIADDNTIKYDGLNEFVVYLKAYLSPNDKDGSSVFGRLTEKRTTNPANRLDLYKIRSKHAIILLKVLIIARQLGFSELAEELGTIMSTKWFYEYVWAVYYSKLFAGAKPDCYCLLSYDMLQKLFYPTPHRWAPFF